MSENALNRTSRYDKAHHVSLLSHKTIACLAGMGWIGKIDLLLTKDFGCALSICTILTDMPLPIEKTGQMHSQCGLCNKCKTICPTDSIHGVERKLGMPREDLLNVFQCEKCLKCMIMCPWTIQYALQL